MGGLFSAGHDAWPLVEHGLDQVAELLGATVVAL